MTSIRSRFIFTIGSNVFRGLLSFITGMILARMLGPESYGNMAFLLGTFMGVLKLLDMGSSSAFFTFMSQKPRSKRFVRSFFIWLGVQFFIPLCIIWLLFPTQWIENIWQGEELSLILLAFTAIFMQGTLWSVIQQAGESQKRTHWVQGAGAGVALVHLLSVLLLWFLGWLGLYAIFIAIALEYFLAAIIVHRKFTYSIETEDGLTANSDETTFKKYLDYCLPLIPYSWIGFAYIFADRWLLQHYSGSVEQAYYAVAAQIAAVALIVTTSILRIFWKEISEAQNQGNNNRVAQLYKKVSRLMFLASSIVTGFIIPWSEELLITILGKFYAEGATTLIIMLIYPVHQSMGQIGGTMLYATERVSIQSITGIIFMIVSMVATYYVLAPNNNIIAGLNLGSEGLALKMVVMQLIQVNVIAYIIARIWNWKFDWLYQPLSLLGCIGIGFFVNAIVTNLFDFLPLFFIICLYGIFYMLLVAAFIYFLPWLTGMTRKEMFLSFTIYYQKIQKLVSLSK